MPNDSAPARERGPRPEQGQVPGAGHMQPAPLIFDAGGGLVHMQHVGQGQQGPDQPQAVSDQTMGLAQQS